MRDNHSFEIVKDRLERNTDSVAAIVSERHFDRIVQLVQAQMSLRFRSKVDAEDVANSVLKSFFNHYAGKPDGLTDWQGLWNLLAQIAMNKLRNRIRMFKQKKRDVRREVPDEVLGVAGLDGDNEEQHFACAAPDDEVVIRDLCDHLMKDFSDDRRRVIELSLQCYKVEEISEMVGLSDRSICRIRDQFKLRLEQERDADLR